MELFVIIMLTLIFMGLTHLINWMWREIKHISADELIVFGVIGTVLYVLAIYGILVGMFTWCSPLFQ